MQETGQGSHVTSTTGYPSWGLQGSRKTIDWSNNQDLLESTQGSGLTPCVSHIWDAYLSLGPVLISTRRWQESDRRTRVLGSAPECQFMSAGCLLFVFLAIFLRCIGSSRMPGPDDWQSLPLAEYQVEITCWLI